MRTFEVGGDADAPPHRVAVPTGWSESAASGFVSLSCGDTAPVWEKRRLPDDAGRWISRIVSSAGRAGLRRDPDEWADTLHCLLLLRQGCPDRGIWRDEAGDAGFVLNAASFADPETGFDHPCFVAAVEAASAVLAIGAPENAILRIADIDGLLARLGLGYDSEKGRAAGRDLLITARDAIAGLPVRLGVMPAGPAEALLDVETAGLAPAFSPVAADGSLTSASRARLAASGLSTERALARVLDGTPVLRACDLAAHAAMHDALAPFLDLAGPRPAPPPRLVAARATPARRALPARSKGFTQKVTIGGHRVFLRTGEYADGTLGEISVTLPGRDGTSAKGLADAFSASVSIGLQHGVPLACFVEAFAHQRFGACGAVEGDPAIAIASSPLDYALRALAEAYLGRHIADPPAEPGEDPPRLPLGLDEGRVPATGMRQRALRLVTPA